jgi:hypothetical protein
MAKAIRVTVSTFGVIAGLAGIEHGVGEILQGNTRPEGITFESWPDSAAFDVLSGEPAMSAVPSLLVSGLLTVLVSVALIVWATRHIERPRGGLVLIGISLVLLLVGGGFGPPLLGLILGVTATKMDAPPRWLRHPQLASMWSVTLVMAVATWLLLMPGLVLLEAAVEIPDPASVVARVLIAAVTMLALAIASAFAHDQRLFSVSAPIAER